MALFLFLVDLWQRFGIALNLDPWYFAAVQAIGWLPAEQIAGILRAYGHAVLEPVCGLTVMRDWPEPGRRDVPQIWIAEPDATCPANQLVYFLAHELEHALRWIRDGLTVWPGHH